MQNLRSPRALLRWLALRLPLTSQTRSVLAAALYRVTGGAFVDSAHYQAWRRSREAPVRSTPAATPTIGAVRASGPLAGRRVLVIEQYIPRPDRDAGSRMLWQICECLAAEGCELTFRPNFGWYEPGYTERLQQLGVHVLEDGELPHGFRRWLRDEVAQFHDVILCRPLLAREYLPLVRRHSRARVIFHGVDIHYERLALQARSGHHGPDPEESWMRQVEPQVWSRSDLILYPSHDEVREVLRHCPDADARWVPIFAFDHFPEPRDARTASSPSAPFRLFMVANFAHAPNVDGLRWFLDEVLPTLRAEGPAFTIEVAGSGVPASLVAGAASELRWLGPVSDDELDELYRQCELAIVPLRFGAGVKGKVVEALRWGLPLVTTSVGVQGLEGIGTQGAAGAAALVTVEDDAAAFARAICALLADAPERTRRSKAMIAYARSRFTRAVMRAALTDQRAPSSGAGDGGKIAG